MSSQITPELLEAIEKVKTLQLITRKLPIKKLEEKWSSSEHLHTTINLALEIEKELGLKTTVQSGTVVIWDSNKNKILFTIETKLSGKKLSTTYDAGSALKKVINNYKPKFEV